MSHNVRSAKGQHSDKAIGTSRLTNTKTQGKHYETSESCVTHCLYDKLAEPIGRVETDECLINNEYSLGRNMNHEPCR